MAITKITNHDVDAGPQSRRWGWRDIQLLGTIMLINIADGLDYQILPLSIGDVAADWSVSPAQFSAAVSAGFVGAALGTFIGGWLGDRWARKPAILLGVILFGLMTMAQAWCVTTDGLVFARLFAGLGLGIFLPPLLALTVDEMPPQSRGTAVAAVMLCSPLGITFAGLLVPRLNQALGWEKAFTVCGAAALAIAAVGFFTLRESPRNGAEVAATSGLNRGERFVSLLSEMELSRTLALMGSFFFTYMAMSIGMSWLPAFSEAQGLSALDAGQAISLWSVCGMGGTVFAGWMVNRLGALAASRLILGLFFGSALFSIAAFLAGGSGLYVLYFAASLTGLFASASITVLFAAAADRFPASIRATGMAAATLSGKTGGIVGGGSGFIVLPLPSFAAFFSALAAVAGAAAICTFDRRRRSAVSML